MQHMQSKTHRGKVFFAIGLFSLLFLALDWSWERQGNELWITAQLAPLSQQLSLLLVIVFLLLAAAQWD